MGHSMLRRGRYSAPGQHYLVTIATADRCPLFADFFNGRVVARAIRELHDSGSVNSVAWVIMPEHLHWIFSLNERPLSVAVQLLIRSQRTPYQHAGNCEGPRVATRVSRSRFAS